MKLLGIETSCEIVTVAVATGEQLAQRRLDGTRTPSETLVPTALALLAEHGLSLSALDAIVLGVGPGAFTGLRLGCSVAQGFALTADLPVLPVCSLDAIAAAQPHPMVFVATDARMGETYHAAYRREGDDVLAVTAPACLPPELVALPEGAWWGAGSAFRACADRLLVNETRLLGCDAEAVPEASALLRLAQLRGLEAACDVTRIGPLYVRDKVALTTAERLARGGKA
ncbi:tRNA (adenosine(37)-N6)-threonylcarbamoyltransferase complex dimerization subunit type 1 TsaB [Nitrogeniibacter mangrovi]|uniref:tRNA (Adenosine(37)-N6)-threonylcarbamoyltransferase complex dimerization subunit type 1 TsaB n=1 Tax=Nitrogeniibacter mangrovi TaxID=2016596 RepID=A0A6C1B1M5_9RHOO|nr:tRNA (adenosine(37)-N6)-threonylcarbamoyltransferase complex dimerization subunit type 1 TsaB [Nitrogeniibacter mangrovi]QID17526.1 tRNA (adenosine(37)-N6)-threonylcarbamoyltransferase complex dimerization subunit type 1 TsaB [Nitrogeniibacter mangrovi]